MTDEHPSRQHDHLVEPMYGALRTEKAVDGALRGKRGGTGCAAAALALASLLALAMTVLFISLC